MNVPTIAHKYLTYRDDFIKGCKRWLDGKRIDDNAEGLWRIHDKLYDLTDFVKRHPGGSEWIKITKGIDITEQFEVNHITGVAEKFLPKFYVRDARLPRNYKITYEENGFYRTLKRRVAAKLNDLDHSPSANSKLYCDFMLVSTLLLSISGARYENYLIAALAALTLFSLTIIAHNFTHQRDNWRMYTQNISFLSFRETRVFHVISHHVYPNSIHDLETSFFEPFLNWLPVKKTKAQIYFSWIASPFAYAFLFIGEFNSRMLSAFAYNQELFLDDLLPLTLPALMYTFGNSNIWTVLKLWAFIIFLASFCYGFVANNAGHHHTAIFHDGDSLKSLDFGVYQLAATIDRNDVKDSLFLTLTTFGNHILHHFFPTLDHAVLPQLQTIFVDTCREFENDFRELPWWDIIIGQFNQLTRTETIGIGQK